MRFLGGKLLFGEAISARIILPNNVQVKHQLTYQLAIGAGSLRLMYRRWYNTYQVTEKLKSPADSENQGKRIPAIFYRTEAGGEPVREWLKGLSPEDRKRIGEDIKTVEFGWPVGMPVCKLLGGGIYEVRSSLAQNRIARVLFYVDKSSRMVLLHGFIKKTQKTPREDLELARSNKRKHQAGLK
jgi:phage-related protein